MAKPATTWEGRRALTDNPNAGAENLGRAARELADKNFLADAAAFFALAGDKEALAGLMARAAEEGDLFLFQTAAAALGPEAAAREQVEVLRAAAEKSGKALYAERAARYLNEHF
jgi:hypothetical protein